MAFWDKFKNKQNEEKPHSKLIKDESEKGYHPYFSMLTDEERVRAIKSISPITETEQITDIQLAYGVRVENEQLVLINYREITEKIPETGKMLYHRHFIVLYGERYCNAHYTSDNEREAGELIYSVPEIFTKDAYTGKLYAGPLRAAMSFYRLWPMHRAFEKSCKEKLGIDVSRIIIANRIMLNEDLEKSRMQSTVPSAVTVKSKKSDK